MRRFCRLGVGPLCLTIVLAAGTSTGFGQAAIPSIGSTFPQAATPGQTVDIKVRGGNLSGPTQLWTSFPAEVTLPAEIAGNGTNAGEVTYRLKLPGDVPPGVHGIRLATAQGISNLKLFAVDDLPSVAQARPNQAAAQAQALTLPVAVDGFVENLTRDYYKFAVAAGQRVSFEILARRLGSPLDPMIRLLDPRGRELAYSDDAPGLGSDSMLTYTFKEAGEYVLEVRDIRFQGNGGFQYRLRIGDFPCVTAPYPMGIQRGVSASLAFAGPTAGEAQALPLNVPADASLAWLNVAARSPNGKSSGFAVVSVGAGPEILEAEPNNDPAQATRFELGTGVGLNGRFDQPGDLDRFIFAAKQGQHFVFSGVTRTQGSPSDLFLRMLKADGAEIASADDTGPGEGVIDFAAPADGDYTLVVEDLHRRGGPEFAYRISVAPYQDTFTISATADTLNIPAGGVAIVTINTIRGKFGGPINLTLLDAPEGVVATPAQIGPGMTTTTMTITCAPTVAAGKVYPVRIAGVSQLGPAPPTQVVATVTDAQKAAFSGLPTPPPAFSTLVAVGVSPAPLFTIKTEKPEVIFGKDLSATVKVVVARTGDFAEEIALAVHPAPPAPGLPPGVTAAVAPIAKGANEVVITFAANAQAPLGPFSAVLLGTGKQGNVAIVQPIPALTLSLQAPFTLKPDFAGGNLAKGQTLKIKVAAERNPAYAGPINLAFQNLPAGVTASAATIPADQKEIEITLTAAADAAVGNVANVIVQGEGMNGNAKVTAAAAPGALNVQ